MNTPLKKAREEKGLKQIQLSKKTDISLISYQRYESGERVPDVHTAQRIANELGIKDIRKLFPLPTV